LIACYLLEDNSAGSSAMHDHPVNPCIRLLDGAFYASDPHPHLQWMREHAPVYWDAAGEVWGIGGYAEVLAIAKDPQTFRSGGGIRPDGPPLPPLRSQRCGWRAGGA
jgi:cytochrome P450